MFTVMTIVGPIAFLIGLAMMIIALHGGGVGTDPKATVMLMAGMMATAFGILITTFVLNVWPVEATR